MHDIFKLSGGRVHPIPFGALRRPAGLFGLFRRLKGELFLFMGAFSLFLRR